MFEVAGKVALITGAFGGIGRCCVNALLQNGVRGVLLVDRSGEGAQSFLDKLNAEFGNGKAHFSKADVSKEDELKGAFDETIKRFGQLDIMINNAGVTELNQSIVDVNLRSVIIGTVLATEEYLPKYKKCHEAVVVNMSSISGLLPFSLAPIYSATKSALVSFGRSFKPNGAKLITLCPGFTETPMIRNLHKGNREKIVAASDGLFEMIQSAEDVAKAMVQVIQVGGHGSVWVVNNGEPPIEVDFKEADRCLKKQIFKSKKF